MLPHLTYSSDLAPLDFYFFRSLQNSLNGITLNLDIDEGEGVDKNS